MAKYKKQFLISLPTSLYNQLHKSLDENPPRCSYEIESFYGILRDITTRISKYDFGMVPMSSSMLQNKYGNYRNLLDYLVSNNICVEDRRYTVGHSRRFSINKGLLNNGTRITQVQISLESSYGKYVKKKHNDEIKLAKGKREHIKLLRKKFYQTELDVEGAILDFDSNKNKISYDQYIAIYDDILSLHKKNNNLRYFKPCKTNGRIDTNITSLKSYIKKYIISDIDLYQIDLKNSQPVLFNILLDIIYKLINGELSIRDLNYTLCYKNKYIYDNITLIYQWIQEDSKWVDILKKEIPLYKKYTSEGKWYEHIRDIYNRHYSTTIFKRNMAKSLWMALAYSNNYSKKYNLSKKAFESEYKGIGRLLRKFKQEEYNQLAICLQQLESQIFIGEISKQLIEVDIIPLTIHDSIIINKEEKEIANNIMLKVLKHHLGFEPTLEKEPLKELKFKPRHEAEDVAKIIDDFESKIN